MSSSCKCGGCVEACTPGNPTVGNTGTADCTDAPNLFFADDFSGASLAGNGWLASDGLSSCGAAPLDSSPNGYYITGGQLSAGPSASGVIYRLVPRPALAGFALQVSMTAVAMNGNGASGLTVGYGRNFFARPVFGDYGRQAATNGSGCGVALNFATFAPTPADGDTISMIIRDQGGADGICTVCYKVNGSTIRQEQDVQFCFPCEMRVGIIGNNEPTIIDDFSIYTS